jgi:hypothetical protein
MIAAEIGEEFAAADEEPWVPWDEAFLSAWQRQRQAAPTEQCVGAVVLPDWLCNGIELMFARLTRAAMFRCIAGQYQTRVCPTHRPVIQSASHVPCILSPFRRLASIRLFMHIQPLVRRQ